jgi:hypothetical protein
MKADPRLISDFEDKMDAVVQCYLGMKGKSFGSYSFGDVTKRKIAIQLSEISKFIRKIQSKTYWFGYRRAE